jgi:hypothetical protein
MPPQQAYGLLDFVDKLLGLCTHGSLFALLIARKIKSARTIGTRRRPVKSVNRESGGPAVGG